MLITCSCIPVLIILRLSRPGYTGVCNDRNDDTVTSENCHDWETRAWNDWGDTAIFEDHKWDTGACNDWDDDTLSSENHYNSSNSGD